MRNAAARIALACAICAARTAAFAPLSSLRPKNPSALEAIDAAALGLDPSVFSDPTVLIGGAGAAIAAAVAAVAGQSSDAKASKKTPASRPDGPDLSIPYDAKAAFAYDAYASSSSNAVEFADFKSLYETQVVAEVTAKSKFESVTEKRSAAEAMRADLAALEAELAGLEGIVSASNSKAAESRSKIEELFGTTLEAASAAAEGPSSGVELWSVDYDAAARLAYEAAGSEGSFDEFNVRYRADVSAMVAEKSLL